mgnify:FL=1
MAHQSPLLRKGRGNLAGCQVDVPQEHHHQQRHKGVKQIEPLQEGGQGVQGVCPKQDGEEKPHVHDHEACQTYATRAEGQLQAGNSPGFLGVGPFPSRRRD